VDWQYQRDSFETRILQLISAADTRNLGKFTRGFPELVQSYQDWQRGAFHVEDYVNGWGDYSS
jgi:hypothetical protein